MSKAKRMSGGKRITEAGRRPILAGFEPADHDKIRKAAGLERRTMTQFFIFHTVAAAEKVLKKNADCT